MLNKMVMNRKGQAIVAGIVIVFIAAVVWASLLPALTPILDTAAGNASASGDTAQALIIQLIPLMGWIVLILAFLSVRVIGQELGNSG